MGEMHLAAFFLVPLFHFFFWGSPWYAGAVWGNVFVIFILGPLGWLWSKTKYWPLKLMHKRIEDLHQHVDDRHTELHARHDTLLDEIAHLHDRIDELHHHIDERT